MKKVILLMLGLCLMTAAGAQNFVERFQQKYGEDSDFTVVNVTAKMFQIVVMVADEEERPLINSLTGLRVITTEKQPDFFYEEALRMLTEKGSDLEELMSVKEKDEDVRMFTREEKGLISELIVVVKDSTDFVLMGFTGNIDLQKMAELSKWFDIKGVNQLEKIKDTKK